MPKAITVEEMMDVREHRRENQKMLIDRFHGTLISFTLNTPGPVKRTEKLVRCFEEGVELLEKTLAEERVHIIVSQINEPETGCEYYAVTDCPPIRLKRILTDLEEEAPLGRIYDMDVIDASYRSVSRADIGIPGRRCMLCGEEAHACARSRRHGVEELTEYMNQLMDEQWKEEPWETLYFKEPLRRHA